MRLFDFLMSFSENIQNVELKIINELLHEEVLKGTLCDVFDKVKDNYYSNGQVVQFKHSRSSLSVTVFTDKPIG